MTLIKNTDSEENQDKDVSLQNALEQITKLTQKVEDIQKQNAGKSSGGLSAEDIAVIIASVVSQTRNESNNPNQNREEQPSPDDWNEKGVRFCAPYVGYIISDKIEKGQIVNLPYNKRHIFFTYAATRKVQTGKHFQLSPLSVYRSQSKKEIEWLRTHPLFGYMFYESSNEAMNTTASKAIRLANIMKMLQPLELHDLYRRCKEYDVLISEDGPAMRANIAVKMMEKEEQGEAETSKRMLDETYKSSLLLGRE